MIGMPGGARNITTSAPSWAEAGAWQNALNKLVDSHIVKCRYECQVDVRSVKLKASKEIVNH